MSRRIPISQDGPPLSNRNSRPVSSSLDLVFSFVRAQSFYENQLPSFADRYLVDSDAIETDSSARGEGTEFSGDESEENGNLTRDSTNWEEELPRNSRNVSDSTPTRPFLATVQPPIASPSSILLDENSSLLRPATSTESFNRRTRLAKKNDSYHSYHSARSSSYISRRLSIISSVGESYIAQIEEMRGNSSYSATLFNMVNVLIGVGLLGLPLSFADSGWIAGIFLLVFCALVTNYTAKLLAKMMMRDRSLETYAEILISAFGPRARMFIYFAFALELGSLSIALVVLFGDSMSELFPSISSNSFKLIGYFIILPTQFLPIRFLSVTSLIGIASSFLLLAVLLIDGAIKPDLPGSLHQVMPTSLVPDFSRLPLSFGIIMSGFSGHAVVPSLLVDMKKKSSFNHAIDAAYIITFIVSIVMAGAGYLMFGNQVSNEITKDLLNTGPALLNRFAMYAIAISPIVKIALISRPLMATIESLVLDPAPAVANHHESSAIDDEDSFIAEAPVQASQLARFFHFMLKPLISALVVFLAIVIPSFDVVLSFLGSCSAFLITAIFPLSAYLIIGGDVVKKSKNLHIPFLEKVAIWLLLFICTLMAISGTLWSFAGSWIQGWF